LWYNIQPNTPDPIWGISLYFDEFDFATGDSIEIFEGSTTLGTFSGKTINDILSDATTMKVTFQSNADADTGRGFEINYWVLPGLTQITPDRVPAQQNTIIKVTGFNFINSKFLTCQIDGRLNIPGTYIDSKTISCVIPERDPSLFQLNVAYNFEVSNDGRRFTLTDGTVSGRNNVTILYFDATCSDITDCAACIGKNCDWCNDPNATLSKCYPKGGAGVCPDLDTDCCRKCQPLSGCKGNGKCECNNTCTCNIDYFQNPPDCSCKKCPTHPNGQHCGGTDPSGRLIGTCDCNGTCICGGRIFRI